jgi:hypothetical protein
VNFTGARNYVENPLHQDDGHQLFLKMFAEMSGETSNEKQTSPI